MDAGVKFAEPRRGLKPEQCEFYHTMQVPGLGLVPGQWDLSDIVEQYLGGVSFSGKRVLEIGPASGFLTIEMEKRGADIVAIEVPDDPGWNFVPYPPSVMDPIYEGRRQAMTRIKNSFWLTHEAYRSRAKLLYTDVYQLPEGLGEFDVAVMAAVLLHCHSPLQIVEQCAKRAKSLIIADRLFPELEGKPICELAPTPDNQNWATWWYFSTELFSQFLRLMGFAQLKTTTYADKRGVPLFTITAERHEGKSDLLGIRRTGS